MDSNGQERGFKGRSGEGKVRGSSLQAKWFESYHLFQNCLGGGFRHFFSFTRTWGHDSI